MEEALAALQMEANIEYCPFLREKNNGIAAGMTEEEAKKIFCKPATEQELHHRNYPGGETRTEFYERNVQGLWKIGRAHELQSRI